MVRIVSNALKEYDWYKIFPPRFTRHWTKHPAYVNNDDATPHSLPEPQGHQQAKERNKAWESGLSYAQLYIWFVCDKQ